jgi:predicted GIY-YIG superfamily endonuclease
MIDKDVLTQMVEKQITETVNNHVYGVLTSTEWAKPLEDKILKYTQDRILAKFANSTTMPEILEAVKTTVAELFAMGTVPGVAEFVDHTLIKATVDLEVDRITRTAVAELFTDEVWLEKIEKTLNQMVVHRTVATIGSIDINTVIHQRVDENMARLKVELLKNFASTGIDDQATSCQLTILDETTVVENTLTARAAKFVESVTVKDLAVTGSINTDNQSWNALASEISAKTLKQLDREWKDRLVGQVAEEIKRNGIKFDTVTIDDQLLVSGNQLAKTITQSNLQKVGRLRDLTVEGETSLNETVIVVKNRLGVNTEHPDSALNVWDEEVSISVGKYKNQEAYIGTNRDQALNIGINKIPQLTIGTDGITAVKKLRVAQYMIGHGTTVPNYSGTKGDIVFNVDPMPGQPFAWVCLGNYKWKTLRAVE